MSVIDHNFKYHAPTPEKIEKHEEVRAKCKELALYIEATVPTSRECSLAITKLEEVMMWANAGIARSVK